MKLAILAEYDPTFEPHLQTDDALTHSATSLGWNVESTWVSTADLQLDDLTEFDGLWLAPGSPYRSLSHTLAAIRYAREHQVPCLGTCGGFQHMVIEFARNVAGIHDGQHAEYDPYASQLIISRLACSLVGREMQVSLTPGSRTAEAYGDLSAIERYYCNFGVSPDFVDTLTVAGLQVVGRDEAGECRVMEISEHAFFVGTLYVPQARSTPTTPHPLIDAFLIAVRSRFQR